MRSAATAFAAGLLLVAQPGPAQAGASGARPLEGLHPDHRAALVAIELEDGELIEAFRQVRDQSLANIVFDEDIRLRRHLSFSGRGRLAQVLPLLAEAAGLEAKVYNPHTLLMFPMTPAKRWAYSSENPANAPAPALPGRRGSRTVLFDEEDASLGELFARLARESGLTIRLDPEIDAGERVVFLTGGVTVQEALSLLMLKQGLTYLLEGRRRVFVYPHRAEKMFEHGDPRTKGLTPRDFLAPHER